MIITFGIFSFGVPFFCEYTRDCMINNKNIDTKSHNSWTSPSMLDLKMNVDVAIGPDKA